MTSVGPKLFPVIVDTSDGRTFIRHAMFLRYDQATKQVTRVELYDPATNLVLDEPVAEFHEGAQPRLVQHRHRLVLASGVELYVMVEGGCGCGSRLKGFNPGIPATSGYRP